jgi:hypothetical protein
MICNILRILLFSSLLAACAASEPGELASDQERTPEARFEFVEQPSGRLLLRERGSPVLAYNYSIQSAAGIPEDRWRSSYIHPVYSLTGTALTGDFPEDHYHHRGLSWMWPNVWVGEARYDLWHIEGLRQEFAGWLARETQPQGAKLGVRNSWVADGRVVAGEEVYLEVLPSDERGRILDLTLTWEAIQDPIRLRGADERSYGGLCLRLAQREDARITSPRGWMETDSDLIPLPWADLSGRFAGEERPSGVAIFQHPGNPDYPAGWCLRYYGFLGVSWPGERIFTLVPGHPLKLRFRIWIHRGAVDSSLAEQIASEFQGAPHVSSSPGKTSF